MESEYFNNNSPKEKKVISENLLSIKSNNELVNENKNENCNILELDFQKKLTENEEKASKYIIQNEVNNIDLSINPLENGNKNENNGPQSDKKEEKVR